jgi:hypothetical protein
LIQTGIKDIIDKHDVSGAAHHAQMEKLYNAIVPRKSNPTETQALCCSNNCTSIAICSKRLSILLTLLVDMGHNSSTDHFDHGRDWQEIKDSDTNLSASSTTLTPSPPKKREDKGMSGLSLQLGLESNHGANDIVC